MFWGPMGIGHDVTDDDGPRLSRVVVLRQDGSPARNFGADHVRKRSNDGRLRSLRRRVIWLLVLIFPIPSIAALVKYLRS